MSQSDETTRPREIIVVTPADNAAKTLKVSLEALPSCCVGWPYDHLADRYGARYVVMTEPAGLYPEALNQAGVKLTANLSGALIYDLRP